MMLWPTAVQWRGLVITVDPDKNVYVDCQSCGEMGFFPTQAASISEAVCWGTEHSGVHCA